MQGGASLLVQLVDPLLGVRGALQQLAQLLLVPVTGQLESEKYIRIPHGVDLLSYLILLALLRSENPL